MKSRKLCTYLAGCIVCICVYIFLVSKLRNKFVFVHHKVQNGQRYRLKHIAVNSHRSRENATYFNRSDSDRHNNPNKTTSLGIMHRMEPRTIDELERFVEDMLAYQQPVYMGRGSYPNDSIDIGSKLPTLEQLKAQTVIVTGFTKSNERFGVGLIGSAQIHMPTRKIIVYDLGMKKTTRERLKKLCNVEVREFPFKRHPAHIKKTRNNGWRILAIKDLLHEYGSVYYAHPKTRFRTSIDHLFPYAVESYGITANILDRPVVANSHPDTLNYLELNETFQTQFESSMIIESDGLLLVNHSSLFNELWKRIIDCVNTQPCLCPNGATWTLSRRGHVHGFDMSVLSLNLYKYLNNDWIPNSTVNELMEATYVTITEADPFMELAWALQCYPPKED